MIFNNKKSISNKKTLTVKPFLGIGITYFNERDYSL